MEKGCGGVVWRGCMRGGVEGLYEEWCGGLYEMVVWKGCVEKWCEEVA